jgi:hypothetical protein
MSTPELLSFGSLSKCFVKIFRSLTAVRHVCLALPERSACSGVAAWPFAFAISASIVAKPADSGCKLGEREGSVVNVDVYVSVNAEVRGKMKGVAAQF